MEKICFGRFWGARPIIELVAEKIDLDGKKRFFAVNCNFVSLRWYWVGVWAMGQPGVGVWGGAKRVGGGAKKGQGLG